MKTSTEADRRNTAPQQSVHSRNRPRRNDGDGVRWNELRDFVFPTEEKAIEAFLQLKEAVIA
jgi:hypothetical protein